MRSAECQVAAGSMAVVAAFIVVADSGPLHQVDSDPQALQAFAQLPADLDQVQASAHLARGRAAFHLLLPVREHSPRGQLYPATMYL